MFGDHGRLYPQFSDLREAGVRWQDTLHSRNFFAIDTGAGDGGEGDRMWGQGGPDIMLGQQGDDRMWGGDGDDDMIGGHNVRGGVDELGALGVIQAGMGVAAFNDIMDGGDGDDVMAGDNAIDLAARRQLRSALPLTDRPAIYTTGPDEIDANIAAASAAPTRAARRAATSRCSTTTSTSRRIRPGGLFGRDIMAGGAQDDRMFGQLGDDLMQGDGEIRPRRAARSWMALPRLPGGAGGLPADSLRTTTTWCSTSPSASRTATTTWKATAAPT
jgi:Ca2+-binding RTX toxin-like protein